MIYKLIDAIDMITEFFDRIFRVLTLIFLGAMVAVSTLEIFSRFVLDVSFIWAPGMVILCSNWVIFLGMGVYIHRRKSLEVSYFYRRFFPPRMQMTTTILIDAFIAVFLVILLQKAILVVSMERYQSSLINLPIMSYWYTMPLLLGCALAALSRVQGILELIVKKEIPEKKYFMEGAEG